MKTSRLAQAVTSRSLIIVREFDLLQGISEAYPGPIPSGLPPFGLPDLSFTDAWNLLPDAADLPIEWLLIDAEAIVDIDVTATEAISSLQRELERKGIILAIARANHPLHNMLKRAGLTEHIGVQHFYPTVRTGVQAYLEQRTKE